MKRTMFLMLLAASSVLFFSCSLDDATTDDGVLLPPESIVYAAGNSSKNIGFYEIGRTYIHSGNFKISSDNNEGVFYDKNSDELIVNSVQQKSMNIFSNVSTAGDGDELNLTASSHTVLEHPHAVVSHDNFYIVSDSELHSGEGRIFIFERDNSGVHLRNTVSLGYEVYGLQLIGKDLYHTIANTDSIAAFQDFVGSHTTDTTAVPHKRIAIEGITNVRGISYDRGNMVLSDVGDLADPNDGSVHLIMDFVNKFNAVENGGTLGMDKQISFGGGLSKLGNPVDVSYDGSNKWLYVAENTNDGGAVLFYDHFGEGMDFTPKHAFPFENVSSVTHVRVR